MRGPKTLQRRFVTQADLDGEPSRLVSYWCEITALRSLDHQRNQIWPRYLFRDGLLDLQAGVDLNEEEITLLSLFSTSKMNSTVPTFL